MNVKEFVMAKIGGAPFFQTISMEIETADEKGSMLRIKAGAKHRNVWETIHGGVIASLADATCGLAIIPLLNDEEMIMTASLHVQYFAPAKSGELVGHGRLIHRGRRLAYAEADILDGQGKSIAKGNASFMIMNGVERVRSLTGNKQHLINSTI